MTVQLREQLAGWDGVREALGTLSRLNQEYETFFGEVFDQLGWLGAAMADRAEHLRSRSVSVRTATAEAGVAVAEPLVEELRRQQTSLAENQQTIAKQMQQLATLAERVDRAARELAEMRRHEDDQCRERAELEAQLELVRQRAVEMSAALEAEQAKAARQQALWGEELQRIRRAVEQRSVFIAEPTAARPPAATPRAAAPEGPSTNVLAPSRHGSELASASGGPSAPLTTDGGDPVLDSVLAQFEMLQKDIARRRAEVPQ